MLKKQSPRSPTNNFLNFYIITFYLKFITLVFYFNAKLLMYMSIFIFKASIDTFPTTKKKVCDIIYFKLLFWENLLHKYNIIQNDQNYGPLDNYPNCQMIELTLTSCIRISNLLDSNKLKWLYIIISIL